MVFAIALAVLVLAIVSLTSFLRRRTIFTAMALAGTGCFIVVLLTHIFERFRMFSGMGWGLPSSPGHYLDLISAIAGLALLSTGLLLGVFSRRREHGNFLK